MTEQETPNYPPPGTFEGTVSRIHAVIDELWGYLHGDTKQDIARRRAVDLEAIALISELWDAYVSQARIVRDVDRALYPQETRHEPEN